MVSRLFPVIEGIKQVEMTLYDYGRMDELQFGLGYTEEVRGDCNCSCESTTKRQNVQNVQTRT